MAAGVLVFSIGILIMAESLKILAEVDPVVIGVAAASMDTLVGVFIGLVATAKALNAEGKEIIAMAAGVIIFSVGIIIMANALKLLAEVDPVVIGVAAASMDTLVGVFIGLIATVKALNATGADVIAVAAGVIVFSVGIIIMANALKLLAEVDPVVIGVAAGAMDTIVGVFIGLVAAAKAMGATGAQVIEMAAGVIIFSIGVLIIANALAQLANVDAGSLTAATIAIGAIIGLFGALAVILSLPVLAEGAAIVLPLLALAFISLGIASILIAEGLNLAVDAISKLATTGPLLTMFVDLVASHLLEFGEAAIAFVALGAGMVVLGAGLLVFGAGALLAGAGLTLLAGGIGAFKEVLPELPGMIQGAVEGIGDFFANLPERIGEIWEGIKTWFRENVLPVVGPFIESILSKLGEFFAAFGEWWNTTAMPAIMEFIQMFGTWWNETALPAIMSFIHMIGDKVGEFLTWFGEWWSTTGQPAVMQFIQQFGEWWSTTALPAIMEFIKMIGGKLGEFLAWFGEWFVNEGIPRIQELAGQLWNWLTTVGIPKLGEFIGMLMGKLGELLSMFGNWFVSEGLPAIIKAGGDIAHWFFTTAIPKLGEFILAILGKLGELLVELGKWIVSDALPAVGKALLDILAKAGELGPMLFDWAKELPGHIIDGIGQVWNLLSDAGGNIVQGIIDGVGGGIESLGNAMIDLAKGGLDAFLGFFGINSPSRLMKNEVAPYIVEGLNKGINNDSNSFSDNMKSLGENGINGFGEGIESGIPSIGDAIDNMTDGIMSKFTSMNGMTEVFGQSLRDGVYDGINDTQGLDITQFGNNLRSMIDGTKEILGIYSNNPSIVTSEEIGQPLSNGIIEGINYDQEANTETLRNNLQTMVDSAKEGLEIHSPSQITDEEIGKPIGEGIAQGILSTEPDISDAANRVVSMRNLKNNAPGGTPARIYSKLSDKTFMERVMGARVISAIAYNNKNKLPTATEAEKKKIRDETIAAGKFFSSGLFEGMDEEQRNRVSDLQKHGMDLVNELKNTLGIHSPSQVTDEEIGQPIGQGIAVGIRKTGPDISNAMNEVASVDILKGSAFKNGTTSSSNQNSASLPTILNSGARIYAELPKEKLDERTGILFAMTKYIRDKKAFIPTATEKDKKRMLEEANSLGKYVTDGYVKGMNDEQKNMTSNIRETVLKVVDEFKDALGIKSPSTVIRDQVGQYIPQGLAEGIKLYKNYAYDEIDDLSSGMADKMNHDISSISPVVSVDSKWKDNFDWSLNTSNWGNTASRLAESDFSYKPFEDMFNNQTNMLSNSIQDVVGKINDIESRTNDIIAAIADGHNIYMDTGTLVGALAPSMDNALGKRQNYAKRGMIL